MNRALSQYILPIGIASFAILGIGQVYAFSFPGHGITQTPSLQNNAIATPGSQTPSLAQNNEIAAAMNQLQPPPPPINNINNEIVPATIPGSGLVTAQLWNLRDADIRSVIDQVSKQTGKNFVIDPRVQGKVTIITSQPISSDELYQVFLAVLQTYGFAAIPSGNVIKIVPDTMARYQEIPVGNNNNISLGNNMVVQVVPVQNVSVTQLVSIVRPLLPPASDVFAYPPSNLLIISAQASKVSQILSIIQRMDQANTSSVEIIHLRNADARSVVTTLKAIQQQSTVAGQTPLLMAADTTSNSILISGNAQDRAHIRAIITRLDTLDAVPHAVNATAVIYLHYLNAKDFVPILRRIALGSNTGGEEGAILPTAGGTNIGGATSGQSGITPESIYSNMASMMANPNAGYTVNNGNSGSSSDSDNSSDNSSSDSDNSDNSDNSSNSSDSGDSGPNKLGIAIQAEPDSNAVIITAPPAIMAAMRTVISQLDIKPQQVLVQAVIIEVSQNALQNLGIEWGTTPINNAASVAAAAANGTSSTASTISTITPTPSDAFSSTLGGLGVGVIDSGRIQAVINFLAQDSHTNILATPTIVVLDNQKASIKVGQKVSFVTGSYATPPSTGGSVTPFDTTDREDVALTLNVTPQINQGNAVRLKIVYGNETLSNTFSNSNPITNDSDIKTNVLVNSGQTLVIGGLINNDFEESDQSVPWVSKIPLVGALFRDRSHTLEKKNLLVFLKPIILTDSRLDNKITNTKYDYMRNLELDRLRAADAITPPGSNSLVTRMPSAQLPVPFTNN